MNDFSTVEFRADASSFLVGHHFVDETRPTLVLSPGRGGSPNNHLKLLSAFSNAGFNLVAPYFEMLSSSMPTKDDVKTRVERLAIAIDELTSGQRLYGVGHSFGATILLTLAGATAYTVKKEPISSPINQKFEKLALMAPATDFFRAPHALDKLDSPLLLIGGENDRITPPITMDELRFNSPSKLDVRIKRLAEAHHFSFMDKLPPMMDAATAEHHQRLKGLYDEIIEYFDAS